MKYCSHCGAEIMDATVICPKCGCKVGNFVDKSEKTWVTTFLICFFLGMLGGHRFYVGRPVSAVFQILTLGGLGFWVLIDLIVILCGNFKDGDGNKISNR